jgi:hypothetical protein
MIGFLPKKLENEIVREYRFRVVSIFLINIFFVFVFACVFILPAYIFSSYKNKMISNQLNLINSTKTEYSNLLLEEGKKDNEIISTLNLGSEYQINIDESLQVILGLRNENIKISSISIIKNSKKVEVILQGVSKTRDGLITYVKDLKKDGTFSSVDLPISDLVKSLNIDFKINLIFDKK